MDSLLRKLKLAYMSTGSLETLMHWNHRRYGAGLRGSGLQKLNEWWEAIPHTLFNASQLTNEAVPIRLMGGVAGPGEDFGTYHGFWPEIPVSGIRLRYEVSYRRIDPEKGWHFNRTAHWISMCSGKDREQFGRGYYSTQAWITEEGALVIFDTPEKPQDLISYEPVKMDYLEPNTFNLEGLLNEMMMRRFVREHDLVEPLSGEMPNSGSVPVCGNCNNQYDIISVEDFPDSYACGSCGVW
jgi:hypothetical protein